MRRSTVLSLLLQLLFPEATFNSDVFSKYEDTDPLSVHDVCFYTGDAYTKKQVTFKVVLIRLAIDLLQSI
jgi:hypothetical protein